MIIVMVGVNMNVLNVMVLEKSMVNRVQLAKVREMLGVIIVMGMVLLVVILVMELVKKKIGKKKVLKYISKYQMMLKLIQN